MRHAPLLAVTTLLALALACREGPTPNPYNEVPAVQIVAPLAEDVLVEATPVTIRAQVVDFTDNEDMIFTFALDPGGALEGTLGFVGDDVTFEVPQGFQAGNPVLRVTALDAGGAEGVDEVALTVVPNTAPSVTFDEPLEGAIYADDDAIPVSGTVADGESSPDALTLTWTGAEGPAQTGVDGRFSFFAGPLAAGVRTLEVTARDPSGATAEAVVSVTVIEADADGDGHRNPLVGGDDCSDLHPTIHPGAEERCNGIDDDCDGSIDEGAVDAASWGVDADGDGHGGALGAITACDPVEGRVPSNDDCDDADGDVSPSAAEACANGIDDDCDGAIDDDGLGSGTFYEDADDDGFGDLAFTACVLPDGASIADGDCDDDDDAVHPDAEEVCNDVDDDCDGEVDGGLVFLDYHPDQDADGYGAGGDAISACEAPDGYGLGDGDCNDGAASIHPDADERCNGIDDDCDEETDEPGVIDGDDWFLDVDGDGFGDAATLTRTCAQPEDTVAEAGDCDDRRPAVNPDGSESCNSRDDDCDGLVDEAGATGGTTFYRDVDGDSFGNAARTTSACAVPAGYTTRALDCDDADETVNPGAAEVCDDGIDNNCDGGPGTCRPTGQIDVVRGFALTGEVMSDFAGAGSGGLVGFRLDDAPTIAVGAQGYGVEDRGAVYLWEDDLEGGELKDASTILVGAPGAGIGEVVGSLGDLDRDGGDDLFAIGRYASVGFNRSGGVYLVYSGNAARGEASIDTVADAVIYATPGSGYLGQDVATTADATGDGLRDLIIGHISYDANRGQVSVFSGAPAGLVPMNAGTFVISCTGALRYCGTRVDGGDLNGDGVDDVVLGAPTTAPTGAALLFAGPLGSGAVTDAEAERRIDGPGDVDFARTVVTPGDLDGDGLDDLVIGAPRDGGAGANAGAVWGYSGPLAEARLTEGPSYTIRGVWNEYFGAETARGDLDGDGNPDLLVRASGTTQGVVHVFYGPLSGTRSSATSNARVISSRVGYIGENLQDAVDLDGDGYDDLVAGAYRDSLAASFAGAAFVTFGGGL